MANIGGINDEDRKIGPTSKLIDRAVQWVKKEAKVAKDLFQNDESKAQKTAEQLSGQLKVAKSLTDKAADVFQNRPKELELLQKASNALEAIRDPLEKAIKGKKDIGKILNFIDAIDEVKKVNIEKEPMKAAKAFGNLFKRTGELEDLIPPGPLSAWFRFLRDAGDFFSDVSQNTIPGLRPAWKGFRADPDLGPLIQ